MAFFFFHVDYLSAMNSLMFWDCCLKMTKTEKIGWWLAWPVDEEGAKYLSERNPDFNRIPYPSQQGVCILCFPWSSPAS